MREKKQPKGIEIERKRGTQSSFEKTKEKLTARRAKIGRERVREGEVREKIEERRGKI